MSALAAQVLLDELRAIGITFKLDGTTVRYRPRSRLSSDQVAGIEKNKSYLVEILTRENSETGGAPTSETSTSTGVALPGVGADLPEVLEVGRGAVSGNTESFLDIVNSWATHDAPLPNPPVLGITKVVFVPVVDQARQPSKVGDATVVLNDAIQIGGFWLRRTRADKAVVEWPSAKPVKGKTTPFAKPEDEATRRAVEAAIFEAARDKGFLLLSRDTSAEVSP